MPDESQQDTRRHTSADVWDRINAQSAQISDIAKGQAAADERLSALQSRMDSGFSQVTRTLESLAQQVNKPPTPTNWIAMGGLLVALIAVFAGLQALVINPVVQLATENRQEIAATSSTIGSYGRIISAADTKLLGHAEQLSQIETELAQNRTERLNTRERLSRLEGRHDLLAEQWSTQ